VRSCFFFMSDRLMVSLSPPASSKPVGLNCVRLGLGCGLGVAVEVRVRARLVENG